jgi:hypothetical protein
MRTSSKYTVIVNAEGRDDWLLCAASESMMTLLLLAQVSADHYDGLAHSVRVVMMYYIMCLLQPEQR